MNRKEKIIDYGRLAAAYARDQDPTILKRLKEIEMDLGMSPEELAAEARKMSGISA